MNFTELRTALEGFRERVGVCRDFTHLAITLCRCMNIPARYATGYLGDIGVPADPNPMDFSAWFEAYLGGQWHTFDDADVSKSSLCSFRLVPPYANAMATLS